MSKAEPMSNDRREANYRKQNKNGQLTIRQRRSMRKHKKKMRKYENNG